MKRVVLIGPEASGKTTLATGLAQQFNAPWTPEAARLFAESHPEPLSLATVEPIARLSMALEDEITKDRPLLVRDTDLVSTVVYARHYYGEVADWIVAEALTRRADLYLLCRPDLIWRADGVRDRPTQRHELFAAFLDTLRDLDARVTDVWGIGEIRLQRAADAVTALLARR